MWERQRTQETEQKKWPIAWKRSQNDPPPDVLSSREVKGEHGVAALRQARRVEGDWRPGVLASAPPGTALHLHCV